MQAVISTSNTWGRPFAIGFAQLYDATDSKQLTAAESLILIRLAEGLLNTFFVGIRDLHRNRQRYSAFVNGMKKTFFAVFQQMRDSHNVAPCNINLLRNLICVVTSQLQTVDLSEQLQRADLAPSNVFYQAH